MVVIIVLGFLIFLALVFGFVGSVEMTISMELNTLNAPFYKIGIFSQRYVLEDGSVEDELIIGLFFVNIVFLFLKNVEQDDE
jgi:hypothetical protein